MKRTPLGSQRLQSHETRLESPLRQLSMLSSERRLSELRTRKSGPNSFEGLVFLGTRGDRYWSCLHCSLNLLLSSSLTSVARSSGTQAGRLFQLVLEDQPDEHGFSEIALPSSLALLLLSLSPSLYIMTDAA